MLRGKDSAYMSILLASPRDRDMHKIAAHRAEDSHAIMMEEGRPQKGPAPWFFPVRMTNLPSACTLVFIARLHCIPALIVSCRPGGDMTLRA